MTILISKERGRPPGFAHGIKSLIRLYWLSVRSVGWIWCVIPKTYLTALADSQFLRQPLRIAGIVTLGRVLLLAEVVGQLAGEGSLHQSLRHLLERALFISREVD